MLTLYIITGIVGGTFIVLSALGGLGDHDSDLDADHDADFDADHDADFDADADADLDVDADHDVDLHADHALEVHADHGGPLATAAADTGLWLPFFSLRFWTYFAAAFGLTGTVLSLLGSVFEPMIGGVAGVTGFVAGTAMAYAMRLLRRGEAHSAIGVDDYDGAEGVVLVTVTDGEPGKVRLQLKGESIDVLATTTEPGPIAAGEPVVVIEMIGPQARVIRRARLLGE
ncbi:MAG: NfeD family protein [Myxococcales bacterium]|nr:NfeD family protein [Myxococcales bacterium]